MLQKIRSFSSKSLSKKHSVFLSTIRLPLGHILQNRAQLPLYVPAFPAHFLRYSNVVAANSNFYKISVLSPCWLLQNQKKCKLHLVVYTNFSTLLCPQLCSTCFHPHNNSQIGSVFRSAIPAARQLKIMPTFQQRYSRSD